MFCDGETLHERSTTCASATPLPVSAAAVGELAALLVKEMVPETAPIACGVKVTANCTGWPTETVAGNDKPPAENAGLLNAIELTTTFAPLALSVAVCVP